MTTSEPAPPIPPVGEATHNPTLWRHPLRGKHHADDGTDAGLTACGLVIRGFWEVQTRVKWAAEDFCKRCARLTASGDLDPSLSPPTAHCAACGHPEQQHDDGGCMFPRWDKNGGTTCYCAAYQPAPSARTEAPDA